MMVSPNTCLLGLGGEPGVGEEEGGMRRNSEENDCALGHFILEKKNIRADRII